MPDLIRGVLLLRRRAMLDDLVAVEFVLLLPAI